MKIFKFERSQILPITIDAAWDYFSDPRNLAEITPKDLSLCIKSHSDGKTFNGMIIEYTVKPLLGISLGWVSEIKHVNPPYSFVDEQRSGPYKFWYHQHTFESLGDKVQMKDVIHYALPFGPLACVLNHLVVQKRLDGIFGYRKQVLEKKFPPAEVKIGR